MRKLLLLSALGLSSMLSLVAGDTNNCDQNACDPCVCCDCEGPGVDIMALTPPAGPNVGECSGFIISADFLYWFSKETDLPYAVQYTTKETTSGSFDTFASKTHQLDSEWAPGFKVALGMNSECDAWSLLAEYTWYHANKSSSTSVNTFDSGTEESVSGISSLTSPWLSGDAKTADLSAYFSHVSADWDLHFNQIDLDLGRHFWLSKCTTVRPFVGLRAGWTRTDFHLKGTRRSDINETTTVKINQDYWGVGPMIGTRSTYQFTECFALYGGGEVALLYGERDVTKRGTADDDLDNVTDVSWTHNSHNCSAPQAVVDLEIGLSYTSCWCDDQSRLRIDLGWEFHDWFNHTSRPIVDIDDTEAGIVSNVHTTDLIMSGLIVKARYDF